MVEDNQGTSKHRHGTDMNKPETRQISKITRASPKTKLVRKAISPSRKGETDFPVGDVTREKQSINEITTVKSAQEFAESIIDIVREPLIALDQDLRVVTASRSFYEVFKVKPEETLGQLIYDLGNKQWDIPKLRELLETILPPKATFDNYEVEHDFATIGRRIMLLNARQIQRVLGKERIILLAIEDITERKRLENELLRTKEENFGNIFDNAGDGILLVDMGSKKFYMGNRAICQLLGYSQQEIKALGVMDIHPEKDLPYIIDQFERLAKGELSFSQDMPLKKRDGSVFHTDINATNVIFAGNKYLLAFFHDITERKVADEKLRETNSYLQNLIIHANAPIIVWDPQFQITQFNRAFESLTGRKAGDVIGKSVELLFPLTEAENAMKIIKETLTGERLKVVEISIQHIDGLIRTVLWNSATIFAKDDKTAVAIIAQGQDITEIRRLEQERAKITEEIKQKNIEMERFTYTVSHDLKSPLVTVKTFLGYLKQDISGTDARRIEQDMQYMNGVVDKMGKLLEDLLEMSRVGRIINPPTTVTFQELVQETLSLVAGRIEERGVKVQLGNESLTLYGDRPRLVEVWQNLVENAVKFMGDQPTPRIDIGVERRSQETLFFIRDNGIGIDPKYQSTLFNLFEKINPKSEGTGMGLAIAKRIVELYQGKIWVESQGLGQGTCFWFTLAGALKDSTRPAIA